jgi:hypothetical protein
MAKRIWTPKLLISNVEDEIATLQAIGYYEQAEGIRRLFRQYLDEDEIKRNQARLEASISKLESGEPLKWGE